MENGSETPARRKMSRAEMRREFYRLRDERGARLRAAAKRLRLAVSRATSRKAQGGKR